MLMMEWNMDDALAVRYEEGFEDGLEKGRGEGREEGREEGMEKGKEITALNALAKGVPLELIHDITGLDIDILKSLQAKTKIQAVLIF